MRRLGFILVALAVLTPAAVSGYVVYAARRFERAHGYAPEGKGFLDWVFLGFRVAFLLTVVAWGLAVFAYARLPSPRPRLRRLEAALMGIPAIIVVVLALLWFENWQYALRVLTGIPIGLSR